MMILTFLNKYSKMERSIGGLESAGEWHILKTMLPSFEGRGYLTLGADLDGIVDMHQSKKLVVVGVLIYQKRCLIQQKKRQMILKLNMNVKR